MADDDVLNAALAQLREHDEHQAQAAAAKEAVESFFRTRADAAALTQALGVGDAQAHAILKRRARVDGVVDRARELWGQIHDFRNALSEEARRLALSLSQSDLVLDRTGATETDPESAKWLVLIRRGADQNANALTAVVRELDTFDAELVKATPDEFAKLERLAERFSGFDATHAKQGGTAEREQRKRDAVVAAYGMTVPLCDELYGNEEIWRSKDFVGTLSAALGQLPFPNGRTLGEVRVSNAARAIEYARFIVAVSAQSPSPNLLSESDSIQALLRELQSERMRPWFARVPRSEGKRRACRQVVHHLVGLGVSTIANYLKEDDGD